MSWSKPVFSSMVAEIGYDDEAKEMTVVWANGRRSAYVGVPEETAFECAQSASVGSYINEEIKPHFQHRYR